MERHYLSKRSRSQKSILVFLAQDAESHVFCYSKADLLKRDQADAVLDFVKFWKTAYGELPPELVFDSKLTTYAKLSRLNQMGITFMTLRRRSPAILRQVANTPRSAWRTVHLDVPHCLAQRLRNCGDSRQRVAHGPAVQCEPAEAVERVLALHAEAERRGLHHLRDHGDRLRQCTRPDPALQV